MPPPDDATDATNLDQPSVPAALAEKIRRIRLMVFDVDGTLTDGTIGLHSGGEYKNFNVQDGAGLKYLAESGIQVGWISSRKSPLVEQRALELGLQHVMQGAASKGIEMERIQARLQIAPEETAAMGDDLADLALFSRSAVSFAPADAVDDIRMAADWVTQRAGGRGAVREAIEVVLRVQGKWDNILGRHAAE